MILYNRGSRTINPNSPIAILPSKWSPDLPDDLGRKLLKMFPRDLTSSEGDVAKINTQLAQLASEKAKLEVENKALREQVANFEKLLAETPAPAPEPVAPAEPEPEPFFIAQPKKTRK